jgi:DNA-binding SARP family transcriptional activator
MEFRILGPLEVLDDKGRSMAVRGAKERALLAILLLHVNEAVTADRLVDELWGEAPPATARKSLQVRVAALRRVLPEGALVTRGGSYLIRVDPDQLDLDRFERLLSDGGQALADGDAEAAATVLREALALWRGPALADLGGESFTDPAVARLEELRLTALELRVEADLALGRHRELVGELAELVEAHPLRERLRGQFMLALYRDGRQAEALELYQRTRDTFIEELGIEPGPALRELHRAVLRQEAALEPPKLLEPARSILVAPQGREIAALVDLGESLARRPARELILARLLLPDGDLAAETARANEHRQDLLGRGIAARTAVFTTDEPGDDLVRLAVEQDVDLLLVDGPPDLQGKLTETLLARAPCDVAVHVARDRPARRGPVFVLFGGAEHDWAAIEIGAWIAGAREAALKIAGPAHGKGRDASRTLANASLAVQRVLGIAAEPVLVAPSDEAVLASVADATIVVAGLPERWAPDGLGRVRTALAERARPPMLLVRRGLRPGGLAPRESLTRFTWTLGPAQP